MIRFDRVGFDAILAVAVVLVLLFRQQFSLIKEVGRIGVTTNTELQQRFSLDTIAELVGGDIQRPDNPLAFLERQLLVIGRATDGEGLSQRSR
jgi:hypothetical protein